MSSIWNPQDRFILSNMTSEKLYAKSPLTTGVSGTSAWIGLEPSSTYNETVLYSGGLTTAANLSEPLTAFDRVKINFNASDNSSGRGFWFEYNTYNTQYNCNPLRCDPAGIVQAYAAYSPSASYTKLVFDYGRYMVLQKESTAQSFGNIIVYINEVRGINRKEV